MEEAFDNLAQVEADDRSEVTNLTGNNMNLTTQADKYPNHLETKELAMSTVLKNSQMQGEIKNLKSNLEG